jgi:hypothetical protein
MGSKRIMSEERDGGYYGIKGFLYQFDRILIEVFRNPNTYVAFENRQDIDYEDYVLQMKKPVPMALKWINNK